MTNQTIRRLATRTLGALALTAVLAACDNPVEEEPHPEAAAVVVQTSAGAELARSTTAGATGSISITAGATRQLRVIFVDAADNPVPVGGETSLRATVTNGVLARFDKAGETGGALVGLSVGTTSVTFELMHGTHSDFTPRPIPVTVTP